MPKTNRPITFYNCHTHIFTIDNVPKYVARKMIPSVLAIVFNVTIIEWLYNLISIRKNKRLQYFNYVLKPKLLILQEQYIKILKLTVIGYWLYMLIKGILKIIINGIKIIFNLIISFFIEKRTLQGFKRYLGIARHATYSSQEMIFKVLKRSYPDNFSFIVLAMDMEFMAAGEPKHTYYQQLDELIALKEEYKNKIYSFVGIDPRRLQYSKHLTINFETFTKENLENGNFSGVKLYPALGFYPFDKRFIGIYKFCVQHKIPIMTHCIEGTIYYRGSKTKEETVTIENEKVSLNTKKEWSEHPILKVNGQTEPLKLPQKLNHDFTKNFTHPFNYKCLLDPEKASAYFGESVDFSELKICLAHFGGSEEWDKYFEDIYQTYNTNLFKGKNIGKATAYSNVQAIWDSASWLSIIYDLMVDYPNVYADMSFMLYNENNFDLLKLLIDDKRVGHKILFGTDFYVVAQKNTEKRLCSTIKSQLGDKRFHKVAVTNAKAYLSSDFITLN
ncbi:hypothetical protein [Psychroserpens sp.]